MNFLKRIRLETEDRLRWHPTAREILHRRSLRSGNLPSSDAPQAIARSIGDLCAAARLCPKADAAQEVEEDIHRHIRSLDISQLDWRDFVPDIESRRIGKSVILKPCVGPLERGVVFISFEDQWARLLLSSNLELFAKDYTLVISPTWSPPHSLINFLFPVAYPGPIFCLISNVNDLAIFPRLSSRYKMVPLFASSWVNPHLYSVVEFDKKNVDILMLANFGKYKRHCLFFKALREMPEHLRVLLIGQDNGDRTSDDVLREADAYGVRHRFELLVNASYSTVVDATCRAKISVILSRREGSCVAVTESMFANTPVGLFENAEIGSRVYINELTGRFFRYQNLGQQLMDFIKHAGQYSPRTFVEKHLSCFHSTIKLNDILKAHALSTGQQWTQDIAVHHWRPDPQLVSQDDRRRLQPAYDDIRSRFGISLGSNHAMDQL